MPVTAIVGAQWGDEGKGKITDLLAQRADLVVRYGGGSNAGHTVVNEHGEFKLHIIPSGAFNPSATCLIGTGTVVDFDQLGEELGLLHATGLRPLIRISSRAQVVMPYHLLLDRLQDEARGEATIGTTRRGIGPAYTDKAARDGIQVADILQPDVLETKVRRILRDKNRILEALYHYPTLDLNDILARADGWRAACGSLVVDQVELVACALEGDGRVLLEGQLGALRDLDWGTYPYVTSSTTIAGGGAVGGGFPATRISHVMGVVKAYITAVGTGPVPTELQGAEADRLRARGHEYGATTGRPRRVGWFDAVATRYAHRLNGFTSIAVTKLDVLDGMPKLRVCTGYRVGETTYSTLPTTCELERAEPVYEDLPGWEAPTTAARRWDDLPGEARAYLQRIEALVGAPIHIVSVGPAREQTIVRADLP